MKGNYFRRRFSLVFCYTGLFDLIACSRVDLLCCSCYSLLLYQYNQHFGFKIFTREQGPVALHELPRSRPHTGTTVAMLCVLWNYQLLPCSERQLCWYYSAFQSTRSQGLSTGGSASQVSFGHCQHFKTLLINSEMCPPHPENPGKNKLKYPEYYNDRHNHMFWRGLW